MVTLVSTLKQSTLCLGDRRASFICTCQGTGLTWVVNNDQVAYNSDSPAGAVRSIARGVRAILLEKDSIGDDGLVNLVSVLTTKKHENVTEPSTVQCRCHNGFWNETQTETFWRRIAGITTYLRDSLSQ